MCSDRVTSGQFKNIFVISSLKAPFDVIYNHFQQPMGELAPNECDYNFDEVDGLV